MQLLTVFANGNLETQRHLVALTERSLSVGQPPVEMPALLDRDSKGKTLLDSLTAIATQPLEPALGQGGVSRESLLASVLQETGKPGEIDQLGRGTCTVTSMQYMLCTKNPAEYGRLIAGLVGPGGTVKLKNGDTLTRVPDSIAPDDTVRSPSERLFQSALMDYGNGSVDYSNQSGESVAKGFVRYYGPGEGFTGLHSPGQLRVLEGLFGAKFEVRWPAVGTSASLYGASRRSPESLLKDLKDRLPGQVLVDLAWSEEGAHAVVCEKIENDRVYFRNPWGPSAFPDGFVRGGALPYRIEDHTTGLQSIPVKDFLERIEDIYVPDTSRSGRASFKERNPMFYMERPDPGRIDLDKLRQPLKAVGLAEEAVDKLVLKDPNNARDVLALSDAKRPPAEREQVAARLVQRASFDLPGDKLAGFERGLRKSFGLPERPSSDTSNTELFRQPLRAAGLTDDKINELVDQHHCKEDVLQLFDPKVSSSEKQESARWLVKSFSEELPVPKAIEFSRALNKAFGLEERSYPASVSFENVRQAMLSSGLPDEKINELLARPATADRMS
jgi:hypothetical protein